MRGKAKLGAPLRAQDHAAVSDGTVGRMLKALTARGVVELVPHVRHQLGRRRGPARRHALRLPKGLKAKTPGALVQVDTLIVNPTCERSLKQFTAYDPVARFTAARACRRATGQAAALFLDHLLAAFPFPVQAIQVDGGAEFMAAFETACAAKGIRRFVLPPRSPELKGAVERAAGAWRGLTPAAYLHSLTTQEPSLSH